MQLKLKRLLPWVFVLLWMALIFYFSSQPADESLIQSGRIVSTIVYCLSLAGAGPLSKEEIGSIMFFVRKAAHFSLYFVLGMLMYNAFKNEGLGPLKALTYTLAVCLFYASCDESHQLFVSGRSGEIRDVGIDFLGSAIGSLILFVNHNRRMRKCF